MNCQFKEYKKTTYVASALAALTAGYFAFKYYTKCKKVVEVTPKQEASSEVQNEVKQQEVKQQEVKQQEVKQEDEAKPASQ